MFGPLGFQEILLILVVALLIFGPKRLPDIGRTIGRSLGEFRRATTDIKRTIQLEFDAAEEAPKARVPPKSMTAPSLTTTPTAPATVPGATAATSEKDAAAARLPSESPARPN